MKPLRVLVGCEESQAVCKAFRALGHEAYSNDYMFCSGSNPQWHIMGDFLEIVKAGAFTTESQQKIFVEKWDVVIAFPPCTHLAVSGSRWFEKKRLSGEQREGIVFFLNTYKRSNCIENPIGIMSGGDYIKKWFPELHIWAHALGLFDNRPQIIQPWMFGHAETKATCLWLRELPPLMSTGFINPDFMRKPNGEYYKDKKGKKYSRIHFMSRNNPDRAKERSKTYEGIAAAMALQWGGNINQQKTA